VRNSLRPPIYCYAKGGANEMGRAIVVFYRTIVYSISSLMCLRNEIQYFPLL